ncbi:hypothetical protein GQ473_01830 [archaeon]|nr:hypothetical protein [archaeon]
MTWDSTKVDVTDDVLAADWNAMVTDQKTRVIRTTGAGVPSSTPGNIGDIYVDTTNNKMYIAYGTSSSSDWKKVLTQ